MNSTVIAVDLAKDVYEVAIANRSGTILERLRLNRTQFQNLLAKREPATVVLEACGTAHHWGRTATKFDHAVRILPAQYVAPTDNAIKPIRPILKRLLKPTDVTALRPFQSGVLNNNRYFRFIPYANNGRRPVYNGSTVYVVVYESLDSLFHLVPTQLNLRYEHYYLKKTFQSL